MPIQSSLRTPCIFPLPERSKLANVESIDYLAPNSAMYRKWLARQVGKHGGLC